MGRLRGSGLPAVIALVCVVLTWLPTPTCRHQLSWFQVLGSSVQEQQQQQQICLYLAFSSSVVTFMLVTCWKRSGYEYGSTKGICGNHLGNSQNSWSRNSRGWNSYSTKWNEQVNSRIYLTFLLQIKIKPNLNLFLLFLWLLFWSSLRIWNIVGSLVGLCFRVIMVSVEISLWRVDPLFHETWWVLWKK